jgi:hypothetical protein
MPLQNKSSPPPQELRLLRNECARHGELYYGYNCFKCVKEGTTICEFVQPILPDFSKPIRSVVSGRIW